MVPVMPRLEQYTLWIGLLLLSDHIQGRHQQNCLFFFFNDPPPTEISPLPHHAALPIFTPRRGEGPRPTVRAIMERLVDGVAGGGEFDLIAAIAEPLPVEVIAELLGVPQSDRGLLRPWSDRKSVV